jgi:hypothetical protein
MEGFNECDVLEFDKNKWARFNTKDTSICDITESFEGWEVDETLLAHTDGKFTTGQTVCSKPKKVTISGQEVEKRIVLMCYSSAPAIIGAPGNDFPDKDGGLDDTTKSGKSRPYIGKCHITDPELDCVMLTDATIDFTSAFCK